MKIDLKSIDLTQFYVKEHILNGEAVYLVFPRHIGAKWQKDNLYFRSSLYNSCGELISASFKKFFNFGEMLELSPLPKNLEEATVVEKIDGSTIIISKYKGCFIIRSRGTIDAHTLTTGSEMEILKQKHPKIFQMDEHLDTWDYSIITEYVSPQNQIVIKYNNVDFILIGLIYHKDYSLMQQNELNRLAEKLDICRPEIFTFNTLDNLLLNVEKWKNKEGVVLYWKNDQHLLKIKSFNYLVKHRFKSQVTLENTLELYFLMNCPSYQEFEKKLIEKFDYECFELVRGYASLICEASKEVNNIIEGINKFIKNTLLTLPSRKLQAEKITQSYGNTNRASFVFTVLNKKELNVDQLKKLYWQILKK